jgi:hypothetical protein
MQGLIYVNQVPSYQYPMPQMTQPMQQQTFYQPVMAQPRMAQQFQPTMTVPFAQVKPMVQSRE